MKSVFYCVSMEFYDNGMVKACLNHKLLSAMPKMQYKQVYKMAAFKIWFTNADTANNLLREVQNKEIGVCQVSDLFTDLISSGRKAA